MAASLRLELQDAETQQARLEATSGRQAANAKQQAAELRQRRQEELDFAAHVQELREEVGNLQMKAQQEAENFTAMQLEEQSIPTEVQALQDELNHFHAEAALEFGLPLNMQFSSVKEALAVGEEAAARLCFSMKLSESILAATPLSTGLMPTQESVRPIS